MLNIVLGGIKMKLPIYLEDWYKTNWQNKCGIESMACDFNLRKGELDDVEILFAYYSYQSYSGEAFVLFRKNGKLYEVNGSHCSQCGLEGQWNPEEITLEELHHRLTRGTFGQESYGGKGYREELLEVVNYLMEGGE